MQSITYGEILRNLDAALEFCESLGLDPERGRFRIYRELIFGLDQAIAQARETGTTPRVPSGITDLEYIVALTESAEFGDILPYLRTCDPDLVRRKLATVVQGPPLPSDEDANSNMARNLLFELNLAARLNRAGYQPVLGEHPDLRCLVGSKWLHFECKRPFSDSKVGKRIKEAARQLRSSIPGAPPGTRGVIAISFSKILNPGTKLLIAGNEIRGRQGLERALGARADKYRRSWQNFFGTNIVGIMFHAITPALVQDQNKYFVAQQLDVYPLSAPNSLDYRMFHVLGEDLERVQH